MVASTPILSALTAAGTGFCTQQPCACALDALSLSVTSVKMPETQPSTQAYTTGNTTLSDPAHGAFSVATSSTSQWLATSVSHSGCLILRKTPLRNASRYLCLLLCIHRRRQSKIHSVLINTFWPWFDAVIVFVVNLTESRIALEMDLWAWLWSWPCANWGWWHSLPGFQTM